MGNLLVINLIPENFYENHQSLKVKIVKTAVSSFVRTFKEKKFIPFMSINVITFF